MIEIDPEQSEFKVKKTDRRRVGMTYRCLPVLRVCNAVLPPLRRRLCRWITGIYEYYACQAYYYDQGDVGFFENFLLDDAELDEILHDLNKRTTAWIKDSILQTDRGIRPNMEDIDDMNMKCSLSDKKTAVLRLVIRKGKVIQFFSKRIRKSDPEFYIRLERLWTSFCPDEETINDGGEGG